MSTIVTYTPQNRPLYSSIAMTTHNQYGSVVFLYSLAQNIPSISFHHLHNYIIHQFSNTNFLSFFHNPGSDPLQIRVNVRQNIGSSGSSETNSGSWRRFVMDDDELERRIGSEICEEMIQCPLQCVHA